jgi:hypothetical protein
MRLRAVLLILVAAAALLVVAVGGFYLLSDPERVRSTAETSLGDALGMEVHLTGPIGLNFLPWPEAAIMTPKVVAAADGRLLASADRIDLALSPIDLVTGEEPVSRLTVVRPALAVALAPNDLFLLAKGSGVGAIDIVDGHLDLQVVPGAPVLALNGMSLERSQDEAGATRVTVDATANGLPFALEASLRRADASGGVPADLLLRLGEADAPTSLRWQGLIAADRLFGQISVQAGGPLPIWLGPYGGLAPERPWEAAARLDLSPGGLKLTEIDAKAGPAGLAGSLEFDAASRRGDLQLELHGAALQDLQDLGRAKLPPSARGYRIAGRIIGRDLSFYDVAVPSLDVTGQVEEDGSLTVARTVASIATDGAFRLEDARFLPGPRPMLAGRVSLDLPTARPVLSQLRSLPDWLAQGRPGALLVEGALQWRPGSLTLADALLRADQSSFHGRLTVSDGQVSVDGSLDRLDLDEWPAAPADLRALLARLPDGMAKLSIGRLSRGPAWIGDVAIEASRVQGRLVIAEASAGNSDDLHVTLAGTVEPDGQAVDLVVGVDAPKPARISSILGLDLAWLTRLGALQGTLSMRGPVDRLGLMMDASSGDRHLTATGVLGNGPDVEATALRLQADAPDLAALLSDLALLPVQPGALAGPVTASADLSRGKDGHWLGQVDLRAGPLRGEAQLGLRLSGDRPRLSGQVALTPLAPGPLQALYDFLSTSLAFAPGSPLRWPGNWPEVGLHWGWLFAADLDLTLRRQGIAGDGGLGRVRLEAGRLDLERLDLGLPSGGRLQGSVAIDGTGEVPLLGLSLALDDVDAAAAGEKLGLSRAPGGRLAAEIDLAGQGFSIAAIVADLAGDVRVAVGPGSIPPPTGSDAPPFAFSSIEGRLEATRGILRSAPPHLAIDLPDESRRYVEATLDLPVWFLDATLLPEAHQPGQHLIGPPGRIQTVEISPTGPASAPGGPGGRTPPRSAGPAPAPTP